MGEKLPFVVLFGSVFILFGSAIFERGESHVNGTSAKGGNNVEMTDVLPPQELGAAQAGESDSRSESPCSENRNLLYAEKAAAATAPEQKDCSDEVDLVQP